MRKIAVPVRRGVYAFFGVIHSLFRLKETKILVLNYHSISENNWASVTYKHFREQINKILETHEPITIQDLQNYLDGKKEITKPSFLVTFDDGYESDIKVVKFLKSKEIEPIVFVISDKNNVDMSQFDYPLRLLSNDEVRWIMNQGWQIGCHSATHPNLSKINRDKLVSEIVDSKKCLEKIIGKEVSYFAYPKGSYNEDVVKIVKKAGYKLAFSMDDALISASSDKFTIARVGINNTHSLSEFVATTKPATVPVRRFFKIFFKKIQ